MLGHVRAVAIDYDGTLTCERRPANSVLDTLRRVRNQGYRVILVTGRIVSELLDDFPDVATHFDLIVAENGAVLTNDAVTLHQLVPGVARELADSMTRLRIPYRSGEALLATDAVHAPLIFQEVTRLGLDCQLLHNRSALMILPSGVSKGTGLAHGLKELDLTLHNCVGIGDAENDHALIDACEIGVAPGNAIGSLKAHADLVLPASNGDAVRQFLSDYLLDRRFRIEPNRWRIELGLATDGHPATIAAPGQKMLLTGESGTGKSYFAGLIAEQLVELDYTLCVLDLEGDHVGLEQLLGATVVQRPPQDSSRLDELLHRRHGVVVFDLSDMADQDKPALSSKILDAVQRTRAGSGRPHWLLVEEAQLALSGGPPTGRFKDDPFGLCLVTWRPMDLATVYQEMIDATVTLAVDRPALFEATGETFEFEPKQERTLQHVRHFHKYAQARLPRERSFHFRAPSGLTGRVSGNLLDFFHDVEASDLDVISHHARGREFSRWIRDVLRDPRLAHDVRVLEQQISSNSTRTALTAFKNELLDAICHRCEPRSGAERALG